ncbi:Ig-like domain-containing protein [Rhodococcus marinonascens]|uniref:Ig-like domain-containing protein n=1 Tax=Rhodococcus marinonascens TaxID=38311 RepID=UPI000A425ED7|nr:Ig-like domain-containing protein [Rhodococcus marinonascens]
MKQSGMRRLTAPISIGVLVGVTMLSGIPAQAETTTTSFKTTCRVTPSVNVIDPITESQNNAVTVEAPASVNAGEEFEVTLQPSPIGFPGSASIADVENVSRIKIDMYVPENAELLSKEIVPGTSAGLSGTAPNILRINSDGNPDNDGNILRLSGNNRTIGNGPNSSTNSEGGIKVKATGKDVDGNKTSNGYTYFQLPKVKLRLLAGPSGTVEVKLRARGTAGEWNNNKNFLTFLPKAKAGPITAWAPSRCSPRNKSSSDLNAGAGPLGSVNIIAPDQATWTSLSGPSAALNGAPVTLTANIDPAPGGGTVQFRDGVAAIGDPVDVVGGEASITHAFDLNGDHTVTAEFLGAAGYSASTSEPRTINVSASEADTSIEVSSPVKAHVGEDVNLAAQITPAVQGGTVEFEVDGQTLTAEVGTDGSAIAPHTFTDTGTHRVVARYSGTDGFAGSVSPAFPVSVTDAPPEDVSTTTALDPVGTVTKGIPVVLTARVDPANAHGRVEFKLGNTSLGTVDVVNGVATLPIIFHNSGTYSVTAEFEGAAGFVDSAAPPQGLIVPGPVDPVPTDPGGGTGSAGFGS